MPSNPTPVTFSCTVRGDDNVNVVFRRDETALPESSTKIVSLAMGLKMATHRVTTPSVGGYGCYASVDEKRDASNCTWVLWSSNVTQPGGASAKSFSKFKKYY